MIPAASSPRAALPIAAAALAALAIAGAPARALAGNKADAFEGIIPPVSGQLYQKAGRFEITPSFDMSLEDAFFTKYFAGIEAGYHFTEELSLSASYAAGTSVRTASAVVCPANQGCHPASSTQLDQVAGRMRSMGGVEVAWAPVYGKLNVLAAQVIHFDLSILGGADWISRDQVLSAADAQALAAGASPPVVSSFGGHVGLGVRFFVTDSIAIRWQLKDYLYAVPIPNWVEASGVKSSLQNQLFTEIGLSFFFPSGARSAPPAAGR